MKRLVILSLALMVFACQNQTEELPFIKVEQFGEYNALIFKGDKSPRVDLLEYKNLKHFYAIGALEERRGYFLVLNSKIYNGVQEDIDLNLDNSFQNNASFLVSSVVEEWLSLEIPNSITDSNTLERFIKEAAEENEIDTNLPFPFLITGKVSQIDWHILRQAGSISSEQKAKGKLINESVEILGFFNSDNTLGIALGDKQINMHFKNSDTTVIGHIDDWVPGRNMKLQLPLKSF